MYLNKAMVFGNLTRDPELRALPSGGQVCNFSIATNRSYKKADGSKQEEVEYHNIVAYGKLAELCGQYLRKGSSAYAEGRLKTRTWEGEKGKQYRTEIIADTVQFGPRAAGGGPDRSADASVAPAKASADDAIDYPAEEANPDDIPF